MKALKQPLPDPSQLDYKEIIKNLVLDENIKSIYSVSALRAYLGISVVETASNIAYIKEVVAILRDLGYITLRQYQIDEQERKPCSNYDKVSESS